MLQKNNTIDLSIAYCSSCMDNTHQSIRELLLDYEKLLDTTADADAASGF